MRTYKLILEYEGTRFHGWQIQPGVKTIQGLLNELLKDIFERNDFELYGSGRTDKGVHALAQTAHIKVDSKIPDVILRLKLNDGLPADISVTSVETVPNSFHARKSAIARSYIYQISERRTAFGKPFVWWIKDQLDLSKMQQAAAHIVGRHNFTLLSEKDIENTGSKIEVFDSRIERVGSLLVYRICATHFLWKMVRKTVSELVTIGRGKHRPEDIIPLLNNEKGLAKVDVTAPPSGLFLETVYYDNSQPLTKEIKPLIRI